MLIKELHNARSKTGKIYTKAFKKNLTYQEVKAFLKDRYNVESSGDLTLEQYQEMRAIIRTIQKEK